MHALKVYGYSSIGKSENKEILREEILIKNGVIMEINFKEEERYSEQRKEWN
jgi:hypothetical protein